MRKLFLLVAALWQLQSFAQSKNYDVITRQSADGKYTYTQVSNDPLKARTYVLKNGLTVILAENHKEPRIMTYIATKAGSKNDPADNTGLAHYLEHMLFKGTDKFGTLDWAKEKEQLDKIDALYEQYNKTTDPAKRKALYHAIDSVSGVASKYAIANEYDKLMQGLGAQGTNAFTSLEQTVYVNDIPQNNLNRWLEVEGERFRNPILRLFHTELEAVYEEKNISLDNDSRKVFEALMTAQFKQHTYGTQTTIGTVEHLKNPSLVKIRNYYNTYYVPNNMAVVLAGDFNSDEAIALVDQYFGYMTPKPIPAFSFKPEAPRNAPEVINVYGPDAENLMIGFRLPGAGTKEARMMMLTDMLLSNSKAGFIDLNLNQQQAVLAASSSYWINKDYSLAFLTGKPKKDQTLEEVKDLLMKQVAKVRNGEFTSEELKAIITNLKVFKIRERASNQGRAALLLDAFTSEVPWEKAVAELDELDKITREELIAFANTWYNNDYVIIYKRVGEDKDIQKIEKPEITPVETNREAVSPIVNNILSRKAPDIKPVFLDYNKDIARSKTGFAEILHVPNTDDNLFQLLYVLDMGKLHNLKLPIAINLLPFLGTSKYSVEQINKEFFKLACDMDVNASNEQVYISLSGPGESFTQAVKLLEHLLADAQPNDEALKSLVARTLKSREDAKKNKSTIFNVALQNYAVYGPKNPYTHMLSAQELQALNAKELCNLLHTLTQYQHKVMYNGPLNVNELTQQLNTLHKLPKKPLAYPAMVSFTHNETNENKVFFVDYKMVQAEIKWIRKSVSGFDPSADPTVKLFNEYFGGGMSSIVFQTIRESKALAYSTYSRYTIPSKKEDPYYIIAYVGTQADKFSESIQAMNELLTALPKSENNFNSAKASLLNGIETQRINDMGKIWSYEAAKKLGLDYDLRKLTYEKLNTLSFDDLSRFHGTYYQNKPFTYTVLGSKEKLPLTELEKMGKVEVLSLEQIFGY